MLPKRDRTSVATNMLQLGSGEENLSLCKFGGVVLAELVDNWPRTESGAG